ncbi:hypothetical protein GQ55_5G214100 [Panicum hallii var. hallii]|uniref:Uncharacterized protein n=1 Tax=Panicum hallii var. hallii TaxID=1504633 RepID=A0A2T7DIT0_9POAL|nr:hypothetical protein GQ55_5G214100 [Panicum hallii var. hallii]
MRRAGWSRTGRGNRRQGVPAGLPPCQYQAVPYRAHLFSLSAAAACFLAVLAAACRGRWRERPDRKLKMS